LEVKKPLLKKVFGRLQVPATNPNTHFQKPQATPTNPRTQSTAPPQPKPPSITQSTPPQPKDNVASADDTLSDAEENLESPSVKQGNTNTTTIDGHQLNFLATMVMDLYEQSLLQELNPVAIKDSLSRYCSQKISPDTAGILSKMINKRLDETC
jgi:hypothetical protein